MHTISKETADLAETRLGNPFVILWLAFWKTLWRITRNRMQRQLLRELPDHILHDIGIRRSEIDAVVTLRGDRDACWRARD